MKTCATTVLDLEGNHSLVLFTTEKDKIRNLAPRSLPIVIINKVVAPLAQWGGPEDGFNPFGFGENADILQPGSSIQFKGRGEASAGFRLEIKDEKHILTAGHAAVGDETGLHEQKLRQCYHPDLTDLNRESRMHVIGKCGDYPERLRTLQSEWETAKKTGTATESLRQTIKIWTAKLNLTAAIWMGRRKFVQTFSAPVNLGSVFSARLETVEAVKGDKKELRLRDWAVLKSETKGGTLVSVGALMPGMEVKKVGRRTGYTEGRVNCLKLLSWIDGKPSTMEFVATLVPGFKLRDGQTPANVFAAEGKVDGKKMGLGFLIAGVDDLAIVSSLQETLDDMVEVFGRRAKVGLSLLSLKSSSTTSF